MGGSNITLKFKDGNSAEANFFSSESDRSCIVRFLEYAAEADLVYYEGMVSYDAVLDLIESLKEKKIKDGVLTLTPTEFWELHVMYNMHEGVTDQVSDFPLDGFFEVFNVLHRTRDLVLTKHSEVE